MNSTQPILVPEDPANHGYDVLRGEIGTRTHYIHNVLVSAERPLAIPEIGERAAKLARAGGYPLKETTFAPQTTRSHLVSMRDKPGRGFVEQVADGRWQLTQRAWDRIRNPTTVPEAEPAASNLAPELRTVDDKGRLLLPREFVNATVTLERVSDTEVRVRKAVVIAEDELPLLEDALKPLSDRDRDLFLGLLDAPPAPNDALKRAARAYNEAHG